MPCSTSYMQPKIIPPTIAFLRETLVPAYNLNKKFFIKILLFSIIFSLCL